MRKWAQPGDDDLDIDVDGCTVTSVVSEGRCIEVGMRGGFGSWIGEDDSLEEFPPGDELAHATSLSVSMYGPMWSDTLFAMLIERWESWRDRAVPLRVVGAPGRMFSIIEDNDNWLPLARRAFPVGAAVVPPKGEAHG